MDVEDAWVGAGSIGDVNVELNVVLGMLLDLDGLQGEAGGRLRIELLPLRRRICGEGEEKSEALHVVA